MLGRTDQPLGQLLQGLKRHLLAHAVHDPDRALPGRTRRTDGHPGSQLLGCFREFSRGGRQRERFVGHRTLDREAAYRSLLGGWRICHWSRSLNRPKASPQGSRLQFLFGFGPEHKNKMEKYLQRGK